MADYISEGAVKVIEVIGVSPESFEDAVKQAVTKAAESVSGITGVEVVAHTARVDGNQVTQFHATCKLAFAVR